MKRILITGQSSYIGNKLEAWLNQYEDEYLIEKVSVRDDQWRELDFSIYDSVVHLAGIAHVSRNPKMKEQYFKVNRDLTIDLANKAKQDGVSQFIFMSSIIVYGDSVEFIDQDTLPKPDNFYGESKLQAEQGIQQLENPEFNVAIVRPPMIYGEGAKGNYNKLSKLARITPFFPNYNNKRSMLYIDNLCQFIKLIIDDSSDGVFCPQNEKYVKTSELVTQISHQHNKKLYLIKIFNPLIRRLVKRMSIVKKVFGDLRYSEEISANMYRYNVIDFYKSIEETERNI